MKLLFSVLTITFLNLSGCDHGLAPPEKPSVGAIRGTVTYAGHPDAWPPRDSVQDLRFVAMRFIPQDTADFVQLNRLVFTDQSLAYRVPRDTFFLAEVETGAFVYSGVAQKYAADLFAWRPVGLYEENSGVFLVRSGDTTEIAITVDFRNPPPFPPPINE